MSIGNTMPTLGGPLVGLHFGLPPYQGNTTILTIVDHFSKGITTTKSSFNIGLLTSVLDKTDVKLNAVTYL